MDTLVNAKTKHTLQHQDTDVRKPYEKPQVIYRAPLEAMAAVCLPAPGKAALPCTSIQS